MDEVDVEGEPIFQTIVRTMKGDTNRALFTETNQDLCKHVLDDIETWMKHKFEHSNDPKALRKNDNVKICATTTDQQKSQEQVKFGAYPKSLVKKCSTVNPNEATDDVDYALSRPEKK
jgi:hypothetical protein